MESYYAFAPTEIIPANDRFARRSEASLVELSDGNCLIAYANHTGRSDNDRAFIEAVVLSREGEPVGEPYVIVPAPEHGMNSMSPALQRLPDGRIGLLYSYRLSVTEACRMFAFSNDEGRSWSEPVVVADGFYKTGCHDRFTVLSSGRLLAPLHCTDNWDKHYLYVQAAFSDDGGKSWRHSNKIELPFVSWAGWPSEGESGCMEPGVAERADGTLLMTIRTAMGTQFCSESADGGETWSLPRSMEVVSPLAPANLTRIPGTSDLLLVWTSDYNPVQRLGGERHTITACISRDGGRTWPHADRKTLVSDPAHSVDYPSVLYKGGEAWISLRTSSEASILGGCTSTSLIRVPVSWFYERQA